MKTPLWFYWIQWPIFIVLWALCLEVVKVCFYGAKRWDNWKRPVSVVGSLLAQLMGIGVTLLLPLMQDKSQLVLAFCLLLVLFFSIRPYKTPPIPEADPPITDWRYAE